MTALFLSVWGIYLTDRIVDVKDCREWRNVSGRMRFGREYFRFFCGAVAVCVVGLLVVVSVGLSTDVWKRVAFVTPAMAGYFVLFVRPLFFSGKALGKEFFVGVFFALGAFSVVGGSGGVGHWVAICLLGGIVAFNCLVIASRDRDVDRASGDQSGAGVWWTQLRIDLYWGGGLIVIASLLSLLWVDWRFVASVAFSSSGLILLHHRSVKVSSDGVRAIADFWLFTPWLFLVFAS